MARPLTLSEALRRLIDGRRVPQPLYEALKRSGAFRWHRDRRVLTNDGRALLRAGDEAAA